MIVETELNAFMVAAALEDVGAMAMGSSHAKPDAVCHRHLERALKILNALDFDKAGASAWRCWQENYRQAVRWPVPEGKDPGDAYAAGVDIAAWIDAGLPPVMTIAPRRRFSDKPAEKADVDPETESRVSRTTDP